MFKHTLAALAVAVTPTLSAAQESLPMYVMADCSTSRSVKEFIYGTLEEIPFSGGWGIFQRADGEFAEGLWKIYASPDWGTFTIAVEFPNDAVMCLVGLGDDLQPFEDRSLR